MIVTVVKALFRIRNSITPWTVRTQLVWTHFLLWRWTFTKSGFCAVCLVLVLVGTGLGMLWRSRLVEPRLNAEIGNRGPPERTARDDGLHRASRRKDHRAEAPDEARRPQNSAGGTAEDGIIKLRTGNPEPGWKIEAAEGPRKGDL